MAIEVKVNGNYLVKKPHTDRTWRYALSDYSATEDSTPIAGGDASGGIGQISFSVIEDSDIDGTAMLLNDEIELIDGSNGRVKGRVTGFTVDDAGVAQITTDSKLNVFVAEHQVEPFVGRLDDAFEYYLSLADVSTAELFVDPAIAARAVVFPGFYGNVWDYMKQMCVAEQIEISQVSSNIVLRPIRGRTLEVRRDASKRWNVQNGQLARTIEIYNYNNEYVTDEIVYPTPAGWVEDTQIYQVDAGQTLEIDIPVDATLTSIQQPVVQSFVSREYVASSVYSVSGNDGLPITPSQWTGTGGSLTVEINPDRKSVKVTILGSTITEYAPYRIAVSAGPSDYYSSLRLVGTGVRYTKELITIPTGVPDDKTAQEVGVTIDNPYIGDASKAYQVGITAAQRFAGPVQTISVSSTVVNRVGERGTLNQPPISLFNLIEAGKTFSVFNSDYAGYTFQQFNDEYTALVQDDFDNQAFGNVAGARVRYREAMYRVRNATVTPGGVNYTAERDTTYDDLNSPEWAGKTFADFTDAWEGPDGTYRKFEDFTVQPLRDPYDAAVINTGTYGFGVYGDGIYGEGA